MNKAKTSKGVTKVLKYEKPMLNHPQGHFVDNNKQFFKVEDNDFPSLSEVHEKNPNPQKDSSTCGVSSFTYSSKLKTFPRECSSQSGESENLHGAKPSKNESTLHKTSCGRQLVKPGTHVQPNRQSFAKSTSTMTFSNKKSTDSKSDSSFSGRKSKKLECFNEQKNNTLSPRQNSMHNSRMFKTVHRESSAFEKIDYFNVEDHIPNSSISDNIQKPPISKSLLNFKKSNSDCPVLRSERLINKISDNSNINVQHKRLDEKDRSFRPRTANHQDVRLSQVNVMHGNDSENASNKAKLASSSGYQMAYNSRKPENNKTVNHSLSMQSSTAGTNETKKKKKRKSKLKRQAALQTGKILVLTPEVHSKIVSQSNDVHFQRNQNVLTDINDNEEYPELGAAATKTIKENRMTLTREHAKENSTNSVTFESEIDNENNLLVSQNSSANSNIKVTTKKEDMVVGPVEMPECGKSTIHSNNPIKLSLFDMLATAKPRKKEPEKKEESTDDNSAKAHKKELIKKSVFQAVNPLASSKPTIKRGKEREKPKIKRPSRMRKLILMERQLRKENMETKRHEAEDETQEKSDQIHQDNTETSDEIIEKYNSNSETSNETLFIDLNNQISEQLVLDCDNNFLTALENQENIMEKLKLDEEIMNNANYATENCLTNIDNKNEFISLSHFNLNVEKDLVSTFDSSSTDKKDSLDINIVENLTELCSSNNTNCRAKHSNMENKISDTCGIVENFTEILEEIENDRQTYNLITKLQEMEHNTSVTTENTMPIVAENNNTNNETNSGKMDKSPETKKLNKILDSSESILNISVNSFSHEEKLRAIKLMLHSRKFRQYCNHFISKEIDQAVFSLIDDLARFQDRMYQKDPVKAKIRRRLVYGIKEIKKHMKLKKVKCIIVATDIEDVKIEGGLNDSLRELISLSEAHQVPCIFSHWRFNLGKVCRKSVPVSCVGIFNYEGSEKNFKKMIELHDDSKHDYSEVINKLASELTNHQVQELLEAEKESTLFLREVSQRILREMVYFTPEGYRNNQTSESLEKSTNIESDESYLVTSQQSTNSNPHISDENFSFIEKYSEVLEKLNKKENLLQLNETDVNTILVKYKVVKE